MLSTINRLSLKYLPLTKNNPNIKGTYIYLNTIPICINIVFVYLNDTLFLHSVDKTVGKMYTDLMLRMRILRLRLILILVFKCTFTLWLTLYFPSARRYPITSPYYE